LKAFKLVYNKLNGTEFYTHDSSKLDTVFLDDIQIMRDTFIDIDFPDIPL
jgi:hypothetical protein